MGGIGHLDARYLDRSVIGYLGDNVSTTSRPHGIGLALVEGAVDDLCVLPKIYGIHQSALPQPMTDSTWTRVATRGDTVAPTCSAISS